MKLTERYTINLSPSTKLGILTQLRTIFDLIIEFQTAQDDFYQAATKELMARLHYKKLQETRTTEVGIFYPSGTIPLF
ncbi:hypothetical protein CHS0354_029166 [Potamilus streckersoni]|uniref:Uncharacterized protein n=1 Tax=Potamilus streckersoni TaxID=2493646 RepID=A0AAE0W6L7_9BIVA|nr:hypothetical protein CHS0354_029166 [Potamilus streckersoni]